MHLHVKDQMFCIHSQQYLSFQTGTLLIGGSFNSLCALVLAFTIVSLYLLFIGIRLNVVQSIELHEWRGGLHIPWALVGAAPTARSLFIFQ